MTRNFASATEWDVALRDGSTVRVRPAVPSDSDRITALCATLSPESVYYRFFSTRAYDRSDVDRLVSANGINQYVVIAECAHEIVGLAQYARDVDDVSRAEAAFLVADAMRGRGIGTRMLEQLAEHAREAGIRTFWALVLPGNDRMLQVFVDSGFTVEHRTDRGVIVVTLSLEETSAFEWKSAERASASARASLRPFFEPASVAIVGASRERGGVGAEILNNLRTTGFHGRVIPIHRTASTVQGLTAYPRLTNVPGEIDLAIVVVPAADVLEVVRDAVAKRVRAIVVVSAGFGETGPEGRAREAELLEMVRAAGIRMIGPNCMGILNADPSVLLNATFSPVFPPAGRVAFSTQSGALGLAILDYARRVNLGISTFASIGNKADVSSNDLIQYWADDPKTKVILLYLESFGNPRKFGQLARSVALHKPIVAVKAGRSAAGARAASSHTGALAASDHMVDALFRHAGVIRTATLEEMFDVAVLLDQQPIPAGRRVAILTNAGGPGILAADACEGLGLEIATLRETTIAQLHGFLPAAAGLQNPIDMLATATAHDYSRAMRILLADPGVDGLAVIFIPPIVTAAADVAAALTDAARGAAKPVVATFMGVDGAIPMLAPIPCYRFPEAAVTALARTVEYGEWRRKPLGHLLDFSDSVAAAREILMRAVAHRSEWLTPEEAQRVVAALGIAGVSTRSALNLDDALEAARTIGYPVALKGFGPAILHKSDVGAVRLNIAGESGLRTAYSEMKQALGTRLAGVLVQQMAPEGVEMFVGGLQDPLFGPVVFVGSGGVLVELFGDASCRLCPVTDQDATDMLNEVRGIARLRGHRGKAPADEPAFRDAVMRVAALLHACPEIQEMDINPLNVLSTGVRTLDVRIRVGEPARPLSSRRVRY